jgi:hypothetical protein
MDLGLHYTLDDANSILDPEVLAIEKRLTPEDSDEFGKVWELFGQRSAPIQTDEFEILKRQYTKPEFTVSRGGAGTDWDTTNDTTALPVGASDIVKITIGDVLYLATGEIVVVKSLDRVGNTIDVYERGAGETTGTATGATSAVKVIGNANIEGRVDVEALAEGTDLYTNYCQLVEEKIELTKEDLEQMRKTGRTIDDLQDEAMRRVKQDLARTAIYGVARAGTKTIPGMTRGLLTWLGLSDGLKANVAGALTLTAINTGIDAIRAEGGKPTAIVMNVANKRVFNGLTAADNLTQQVTDRQTGRVVDTYLADGIGAIPVIVDIDMPNSQVVIVDSRKLSKGWKVGDELKLVDEPATNSRQMAKTIQGKFGLAVEGLGQSHYLMTGLTT